MRKKACDKVRNDPKIGNEQRKIVITTDGKETLARLYEGDKVIRKSTAKCAPDDTFDFAVGAKIAFNRPLKIKDGKKYKLKPYDAVTEHKGITKFTWGEIAKKVEGEFYHGKDADGTCWWLSL